MFDFNGENLKVGDKVIVYQSHFSSKAYYVGTVVKRTPTAVSYTHLTLPTILLV